MTPKEKAKQLFDKFYDSPNFYFSQGTNARTAAKECALICIDEIIQTNPHSFWLECRDEINLI